MSWINAAREVVKQKTAYQVDVKTGKLCGEAVRRQRKGTRNGVILDGFTASMLCQIYDALSDSSQVKFDSMPITSAVTIGWKLCDR